MEDNRMQKLSEKLVNYSCGLKKGQSVLIEATGVSHEFICALVKEVYKVGAQPFVSIKDNRIEREILMDIKEDHVKEMAKYDLPKMKGMDAYIGIGGGNNIFELSDVSRKNIELYSKHYSKPVHRDVRLTKTNWVIMRYPTQGMSQLAKQSTKSFEDFYFNVCNLDYEKMDKAMGNLKILMEKTDKVKIVTPTTDLEFSIKGIPAIKCAGKANIPDGEVYTAPVRDSVNGHITFNVPSMQSGVKHENITFKFLNGKIIEHSSSNNKALEKALSMDEGAKYLGEFAIGVNPFILHPMLDTLFDEKIAGSVHLTPGACYNDAYNGNKSAIHWDLVQIHRKEYGGGEIYFDNVLVRKDGIFVLENLKCLNPENLK